MANNGKSSEDAWVRHWTQAGGVVERLRDAADLRGRNGNRHVGAFPVPSDFLLTKPDGRLEYAEVKSTENATSFPFGDIRPAQSSAALRQAKVDGPYLFYIFSFHSGSWYVMDSKQYADAVNAGRRSLKWTELTPWTL